MISFLRKKDTVAEGGFEILSRLIAPELTTKTMMEQYRKSLYVFACISKIANKVASVDFELFRILNSKGEMKQIFSHPALDLLNRFNPFQTKTEFLETTMINLKTAGDAFWFEIKNKSGRLVELWNLRPDMMTIVTDPVRFIKRYEFQKSDGSKVTFEPEDIVHFKYADPLSSYLGMSPLRPASKRVQTEEYATDYQRDFFLNSARPDAVIKNKDTTLTPEQKMEIKEFWEKRHRGIKNSSKVAILEGGLEYQQISLNQKEMDYIESMKFTRDDILVAFGVPKPVVAVTDDVNRANAETAMFIFLSETIKPELVRITEKINEELIAPAYGDEFFIKFVDPTPENRELIIKEYEAGLKNNYLLINEVRQSEGLPPVKGGWSFYRPLTDIPIGGLPQTEKNMQNAKEKSEVYLTPEKEKIPVFDFKGKYWLKQRFEIIEALAAAVVKKIESKDKGKGKKEKDKKLVSLLKDPEIKKAYAGMINKKIDARSSRIKEGVDEFAASQGSRVISALEKNAKEKDVKTKAVSIEIETIFNEKAEGILAVEFVTPYLDQFIKDSGAEALEMIAPQETFNTTQKIQTLIKQRAELFAKSVNSTTVEKLSSTLADGMQAGEGIGELTARVESVYQDFPLYRSELIARTEATAANNMGMLEGFEQSDVATGKEWINAGDGRVRPEHQDGVGVGGEIVGLRENFSNGLQYPMEPNCRCVTGPAFLE